MANLPPVARFEATGLADVIVIAGPNGVGKTRLLQGLLAYLRSGGAGNTACVIESTCPEESEAWGKSELDLADPADVPLFQQTIQATRRRRNWKSSIVNFESDRSLRNLVPLAFTFDMQDPEEEQVGWDSTFGFMRDRYQDTVDSLFRMIQVQKQQIANRAVQLRREGRDSMQLSFTDPMQPFKELFQQLLGPKRLVDPSPSNQRLEYEIDGQIFNFDALSSGEREVVTIAFDFLLRKPMDCMVFFDEPELHLHPELSFRLIQALQTIGSRNQLVLSTHSPDIITASLDRSVIFLSPPSVDENGNPRNQAIAVDEADETNQALNLLGHSIGIIALGRRIVLIEGSQSSVDKQTYGSLIQNRWPGMVLVPSGGKHAIESFQSVYEAVLSRSIWGVEFFMLCDGDTRPAPSEGERQAEEGGRLRVLPRYHLENYFLDEHTWAAAFANLEPSTSWLRDPVAIEEAFLESARTYLSYAAALRASQTLRLAVGNVDIMPSNCHGRTEDEIIRLVLDTSTAERERTAAVLAEQEVERLVREEFTQISELLDRRDAEWRRVVPGKPLLSAFVHRAGMKIGHAKSLYLAAAEQSTVNPFADVLEIFEAFAS